MNRIKKKIKKDINNLLTEGRMLLHHEAIQKNEISSDQKKKIENYDAYRNFKKSFISLISSYQNWYSKALPVVKQILPERYNEFISYYQIEKRNKINFLTYTISDYLIGLRLMFADLETFNTYEAFSVKFQNQLGILESVITRIDTVLTDIEGILQSELFVNELEATKDLLKKRHFRASGTLAGITLEIHLSKVCKNHNITLRKRNPTTSDYNDKLKNAKILDIPTWRLIQRLIDIRNLSAHLKDRDPKKDEIEDLIQGCEKIIAEVF